MQCSEHLVHKGMIVQYSEKVNMENHVQDWVLDNCRFAAPKNRKGILVVFEGIDGTGKTTQSERLMEWLEKHDYSPVKTKWNSSELVSDAITKGKDSREMTPMLYSLMHAADLISRLDKVIMPALKRGRVVVADRYWYTSLIRDTLRGIDPELIKKIYADIREPDLVFHCVCPIEIAYARVMEEKGLTYYGSGMDLNLAKDRAESCLKYEGMMDRKYRQLLSKEAKHYFELDTNRPEKDIFEDVKNQMSKRFEIEK